MESDQLRLRKKTLQSVLEQCQTALDLIGDGPDSNPNSEPEEREEEEEEGSSNGEEKGKESDVDFETDELRDLLKSKFESPEFLEVLEKLGSIHMSVSQCDFDDCASWDIVTAKDLRDEGGDELDQDDFVIVKKEDVVDGIACFMAAYLLSLEQAKELTPNQLQEALRKTFSVKKKKGKLQKAWDGSVVIYNVASWGATAIGIYQNPAIVKAASVAFWTSCRVISRLL